MGFGCPNYRGYVLHGLAVALACEVDTLEPEIARILGEFETDSFPEGFVPLLGTVETYNPADLERYLPARARRITGRRVTGTCPCARR